MAMKCPLCGSDSEIKETRSWIKDNLTRRTYQCYGCPKTKQHHIFKTHEKVVGEGRLKPESN